MLLKKNRYKHEILCVFVAFCLVGSLFFAVATAENSKDRASTFWLTLAGDAWKYFQPGVGVDAQTGLPWGTLSWPYYSDWDLGNYLQAILDAEKIGILASEGRWGADYRINMVLAALETRPKMVDGLPYQAYSAQTGKNATEEQQVATDQGNLFVALKNVENAKPELKQRIDNIVYNQTNYEKRWVSIDILLGQLTSGTRIPNVYDYYATIGFAMFWPDRFSKESDEILDFVVSAPKFSYEGVELPAVKVTSEPLLMAVFNLPWQDNRTLYLSRQASLAQEARFNLTGKYTAFSEGIGEGVYVWEWIATQDMRTWVVQTGDANDVDTDIKTTPIAYLKAAVGYLALYNSDYSRQLVSYMIEKTSTGSSGFYMGVDEEGNVVGSSCDTGNALIVTAARYALDNHVDTTLEYPVADAPTYTPSTSTRTEGSQTQITADLTEEELLTEKEADTVPEVQQSQPQLNTSKSTQKPSVSVMPNLVSVQVYPIAGIALFVIAMYIVAKKNAKER